MGNDDTTEQPDEPERGHAGHDHPGGRGHAGRWRRVRALGIGLALLVASLLVPAAVAARGALAYGASKYTQPPDTPAAAAAVEAADSADELAQRHDPDKPTAVVVVGNQGANIVDSLPPYEVLAATEAFNLYTVAPHRRPLPLRGEVDLLPDLSFEQLDELLGGQAPDVTVVPEMPDSDEALDAEVTTWLRETASDGLVLSVCTGARLVAEAGLLDGREATTHWYRLARLERAHPEVDWQRGIRYVDTGDVITSGGLLSGIDGTLRVIERLFDADTAAAAAQAVGWEYYSPGAPASLPDSRLTPGNAMLSMVNVGFRWDAPTVGVVLTDGVGEVEIASAFSPWVEHPSRTRTLAVTGGGGAIRSRHGLTLIPRADLDTALAGAADRLVVPGADAAASPDPEVAAAADAGVPVTYLHEQPGFAFHASLREVARTLDVPTARWAAKVLEYPADGLGLSGPGWPWTSALRGLMLALAGLGAALGIALGARRLARRRRAPAGHP